MSTYRWSPLSVFWIRNMLVFFSNLFRVFFYVVWKKKYESKREKFSYMKNLTTKWKLIRHLQDKKMTVVYLRGVWRGLQDYQRPKTSNFLLPTVWRWCWHNPFTNRIRSSNLLRPEQRITEASPGWATSPPPGGLYRILSLRMKLTFCLSSLDCHIHIKKILQIFFGIFLNTVRFGL